VLLGLGKSVPWIRSCALFRLGAVLFGLGTVLFGLGAVLFGLSFGLRYHFVTLGLGLYFLLIAVTS